MTLLAGAGTYCCEIYPWRRLVSELLDVIVMSSEEDVE